MESNTGQIDAETDGIREDGGKLVGASAKLPAQGAAGAFVGYGDAEHETGRGMNCGDLRKLFRAIECHEGYTQVAGEGKGGGGFEGICEDDAVGEEMVFEGGLGETDFMGGGAVEGDV